MVKRGHKTAKINIWTNPGSYIHPKRPTTESRISPYTPVVTRQTVLLPPTQPSAPALPSL